MNLLNKLERKLGKYAISNISLYLILCYACGYILELINPYFLNYLTLNPYEILHGQVWRIFTWILVPPSDLGIFTIITLYFYYSIGTSLERTWGTFYYNVYLFMGMIFTVLGSFVVLGICPLIMPETITFYGGAENFYAIVARAYFSTYYVNMSIFLAFAMTFPSAQVLLWFLIPVKMKWMGIVYVALIALQVIQGDLVSRVVIIASLLNFIVFFLMTRRGLGMRISPKQVKRRYVYKAEVRKARPQSASKHKCAICGKTSDEYPELEFRFCSKCNGNYEYCQDHLFTHTHIQ